MPRVLALSYSTYGHIETMSRSVVEGARAAGAVVDVKRVAETVPEDVARSAHFKLDQDAPQDAPLAAPGELVNYDAIIVGSPTRYGRLASQMAAFWDQTGGQETTLFSLLNNLIHHGMIVTGQHCSFKEQMSLDEIVGGSPYGATTVAGGDGSRPVGVIGKAGARFLGAHVAAIAAKLFP